MTSHDTMSRHPGREQPADIQDDMTVSLHTTPYHMSYLPMSSLTVWHTLFFVLHLTVVIPETYLYLHREGRPLSSGGSIPHWGDGPSYIFSRVAKLSPFLLLYLTVMNCGPRLRMNPRASNFKYSTSNILGRDWIEVASEMSGHLP